VHTIIATSMTATATENRNVLNAYNFTACGQTLSERLEA
jgi:hypothetical protein